MTKKPTTRKKPRRVQYASFSLLKKSEGGTYTFDSAKKLLEDNGFKDVEEHPTTDEKRFRLAVPKTEKKRAATILFSMTTKQFLAALDKLDLTPSGAATAGALGVGLRQVQRIAAGDVLVPIPVAKLLKQYLKHGVVHE